MRKVITRCLLAIALLAVGGVAAVGQEVATDAKPAEAALTDWWSECYPSTHHSYCVRVEHHSEGYNTLRVSRFGLNNGPFLGIEVQAKTWDFICFGLSRNGAGRLVVTTYGNDDTSGQDWPQIGSGAAPIDRSCNLWESPPSSNSNCHTVHTGWANGFMGYQGNWYQCPFFHGTGELSYGYWAPMPNWHYWELY